MSYDDYGYGGLIAFLLILVPILFVLAVAGYVVGAFFLMKVFEKAGVQGKWRAWVPVYNTLILAKLGDLSPWVMLGALLASGILGQIPVIGWVFGVIALAAAVVVGWRVGLKLQKDWPLLLLWLIPGVGTLIWLGILAFDKASWNPNIARAPWADSFLKDTTAWAGIPAQPGAPAAAAPGAYPPPAGYQPPAGYTPPPAPPAAPPTASPPAAPPAAAPQPPVTPPASPEPPAPPASPTTPPAS